MRAELRANYDNNRKRLADIIPLEYPFTVYIEQTRYCNFKCFYCIHATRDEENGPFKKLNYDLKHMKLEDFEKVIDQLRQFPKGIKRIVFSGLGEPLMNPELPKLIKLAVDANIAERVEIITNGILLTPPVTDSIVDAGITNINISIQGINDEEYVKNCGAKITTDKLIKNLTYLYEHKKQAQIYIKVIDAALNGEEENEQFFKLFGNICDRIYIEHLIVMQQQMEGLKEKVNSEKNFYNESYNKERKVCAPAFYFLQVGCDLDVYPCPIPGLPRKVSLGNIRDENLVDIWNGQRRKKFLRTMLELKKDTIPICKECTNYNCINNELENLDTDAEELVERFY